MNYKKWLKKNTKSLKGKTIAITGTTGGIGKQICLFLAQLGANLILVDRNSVLSNDFKNELCRTFSNLNVECIQADLENFKSVTEAAEVLKKKNVDVFIHNAGAYSIPRKICDTGFDNVFQINFVSPYYIINELLPFLKEKNGKVVAVGSIAHNYSETNVNDIDFKSKKAASLVYGNAKRYLMFSLFELFKKEKKVTLSIVHPGITFTKITNHYPKLIFAIIKYPMKIIFMKPKKACLSVLKGVFSKTDYFQWIGPWFLNVWGCPKTSEIKTCKKSESKVIGETAQKIYNDLIKKR